MRLFLLVAILLIPGASAELIWHAPDTIAADHPVFAAYTIEEGGELTGHVNVELNITLDGHPLVDTASVHEHDGVFTMVVTPPAPGTLRLVGSIDGKAFEHVVEVTPTEYNETGFGEGYLLDRGGARLVQDTEAIALLEATADGLTTRAWVDEGVLYTEDDVQALLVTHPDDPAARGARLADTVRENVQTAPRMPDLAVPECTDVVADPNSGAMVGRVWQAGSQIRLVHMDGPTTYTIPGQDDYVIAVAEDPFGQLTFRAPVGPGTVLLDDCQLPFQIVPAPTETGELELTTEPLADGVSIHFAAQGPDGLIGHYEFDTRITLDDGLGRLVWTGKLHGHGGESRLDLASLPAGNYTITTFPSPQGLDSPVIAGMHTAGFVVETSGNATAPWLGAARADETEEPDQSTPLPWFLALAAVALWVRRR